MKLSKSYKKQLKDLNAGEYQDASIHIVLLDLCLGNGIDEVFMMLHNVATEMGKRSEFEKSFEKARSWKWREDREDRIQDLKKGIQDLGYHEQTVDTIKDYLIEEIEDLKLTKKELKALEDFKIKDLL